MELQGIVDWLGRYEAALSAVAAMIVIVGVVVGPLRSRIFHRVRKADSSPAATPRVGPPDGDARRRVVFVSPFEVAGTEEVLSVGLASELSNALQRTAGVEVVVAPDEADYLVTGTLLPMEDRVRVLAQLRDRRRGRQLWSREYELAREGFFNVQREIAGSIVAEIGGELMSREFERMRFATTGNTDAWTHTIHSANLVIQRRGGVKTWDEAIEFANKAIALDSEYAAAHGRLAALHAERIANFLSPDIEADVRAARNAAETASSLASFDPYVMMNCGQGWTLIGEVARGREALDRALGAVPYDVLCWLFHWINLQAARDVAGIEVELPRAEAQIARHPDHPLAPALWGCCGLLKVLAGDPEGALPLLRRCYNLAPGFGSWSAYFALQLHSLGQTDEAQRIASDLRERGFRLTRGYLEQYDAAVPGAGMVAALQGLV